MGRRFKMTCVMSCITNALVLPSSYLWLMKCMLIKIHTLIASFESFRKWSQRVQKSQELMACVSSYFYHLENYTWNKKFMWEASIYLNYILAVPYTDEAYSTCQQRKANGLQRSEIFHNVYLASIWRQTYIT